MQNAVYMAAAFYILHILFPGQLAGDIPINTITRWGAIVCAAYAIIAGIAPNVGLKLPNLQAAKK